MTTLPIEPVPAAPPSIETPSAEPRWASLRGVNASDRVYKGVLTVLALTLPFLIVALFLELFVSALPAIKRYGFSFLWTSTWDPVAEIYGAAPMIFGTLASSLIALLIAVPLALGVAIFLTEFAPRWVRQPLAFLVEMLAAIPSVVYGLWGIFVLIPFLRTYVVPSLKAVLGWTPFFQGVFYGNSLLAGGVILAIMIVPYIAAVSREVLLAVPASQREAAVGLGATRWEALWTAVVPYGRAGLIGAGILGLGRALGETMALTMVIGNRHDIGLSVLQPAYTMAAAIANEFSEATTNLYLAALFEVGLILFVITVLVNALARLLIWRVAWGAAPCEPPPAPPARERGDDRARRGALVRRGPLPCPDPRQPGRTGRLVARLELLHPESRPRGPSRRRRRQCDRRDGAGRRALRLDVAGAADGSLLRACGRRGPRRADDPDDRPHHRGDGPPRAALAARSGVGARLPALAHVAPHRGADRAGRHRDRLSGRGRAHRRRDRAAAVHRARQPQLLDQHHPTA